LYSTSTIHNDTTSIFRWGYKGDVDQERNQVIKKSEIR